MVMDAERTKLNHESKHLNKGGPTLGSQGVCVSPSWTDLEVIGGDVITNYVCVLSRLSHSAD